MGTTYRLRLAYDGGSFAGFRRQGERTTVEGVLRQALFELDPAMTAMAFAGATDRGVHAWGQVVSFRTQRRLDLSTVRQAVAEGAPSGSNRRTGFDELDRALDGRAILIRDVLAVPRRFHASFSARARRYRFMVRHHANVADVDAMLRALEGTRDVRALARRPRPGASTKKTIMVATAFRRGEHICFDVTASGFLRRQMRVLVATVLREAEGGAPPGRLVELCALGDPRATAPPTDPEGLCLWAVDYEAASDTSEPSLEASTAVSDDQSSSSDEVSQRPSR